MQMKTKEGNFNFFFLVKWVSGVDLFD